MGLLVEGKWHDTWYETKSTGGHYKRKESSFRNWITKDGSAGPSGSGGFKAEENRYHLYVSLACPWAHRTIIYRKLKGLESLITMSGVNSFMGAEGWTFEPGEGVVVDPILQASRLHQIYTAADPEYTGRVSVPVLWDKKTNTIVSNESSEIIRMFNSEFDEVGAQPGDFSPAELLPQIDEINEYIYHNINNGVYKAGFATTQKAYEHSVNKVFTALDSLELRLSKSRYLIGNVVTEADWRFFTTLVRFDIVYVGHFKCNLRRIIDYPNIWAYLRDLYQIPKVAETVAENYIKAHYYASHETINPTRIIPAGPIIDFTTDHHRQALFD